ncbi:MAG: threonine--tRNA ligase [Candidatus Diapherotrites archaeon]|nr:threonine--tRNA ligase [Candidatus Diapherotrites archaeon]
MVAEITVTLPDNSQRKYKKGITGKEIAESIGKRLAEDALAVKVNDKILDLSRVIEADCKLQILTADSKEGKSVLWHSSAHVMATAVKELFPKVKLGIGPPIDQGFYYDFLMDHSFAPEDLEKIEKKMLEHIQANEVFVRTEFSKKEATEKVKTEPLKTELVKELLEDKPSFYTNGPFTDLCRGPHVPSTGYIKAVKLLKTSSAYWKGNEKNAQLQRIYGISFVKEKQLAEYLNMIQEAEKRDHVKLGKELDLLSVHPEAPGMPFLHAKGMIIWNELVKFWMKEHAKRNYKIVNTPQVMKKDLWITSGHWENYRENMYSFQIDDYDFAIKPMNCPGHILLFKEKRHSYKELPLKIAELGIVHRHERSGVLHGLFRVRKFTQDDSHIFCMENQIEQEVLNIIELMDLTYKTIGFTNYHIELSTRPEKSMGTEEQWQKAEQTLKNALEKTGKKYKINPGDGAFYGPKIDFHIQDAIGRTWQCGTIQLDFNQPERFDVTYVGDDDQKHRPYLIHRVIFGSLERFLGVLIEHYAGNFPLWLSPEQTRIITVSDAQLPAALKLKEQLLENEIRAEVDERTETLGKKVRDAQLEKVPVLITLGEKEVQENTVTIRARDGKLSTFKVSEFIEWMQKQIKEKK